MSKFKIIKIHITQHTVNPHKNPERFRHYYYFYFVNKKNEAQREVICQVSRRADLLLMTNFIIPKPVFLPYSHHDSLLLWWEHRGQKSWHSYSRIPEAAAQYFYYYYVQPRLKRRFNQSRNSSSRVLGDHLRACLLHQGSVLVLHTLPVIFPSWL